MSILSKYSYDFISDTYEFNEELLVKMMMSISLYDLTLSSFYFDEGIFVKITKWIEIKFSILDYLVRSMVW